MVRPQQEQFLSPSTTCRTSPGLRRTSHQSGSSVPGRPQLRDCQSSNCQGTTQPGSHPSGGAQSGMTPGPGRCSGDPPQRATRNLGKGNPRQRERRCSRGHAKSVPHGLSNTTCPGSRARPPGCPHEDSLRTSPSHRTRQAGSQIREMRTSEVRPRATRKNSSLRYSEHRFKPGRARP